MKPKIVATVRSNELLARLEIDDLEVVPREKMLHLIGHLERSSGAIKIVCDTQIEGKQNDLEDTYRERPLRVETQQG